MYFLLLYMHAYSLIAVSFWWLNYTSVFLQLPQWSALHFAAHDDDIASVEQFIKTKENINAPAAPVSVKKLIS